MSNNWTEINQAIAQLGDNALAAIAGCTVTQKDGQIYIDLNTNKGDSAASLISQAQEILGRKNAK